MIGQISIPYKEVDLVDIGEAVAVERTDMEVECTMHKWLAIQITRMAVGEAAVDGEDEGLAGAWVIIESMNMRLDTKQIQTNYPEECSREAEGGV